MVRDAADSKSLALYYDCPEHVHTAFGDTQRLRQIIVNLLSNAVKFTPKSGRVGLQVRGSIPHQKLLISVWDTGIGIADDDMHALFQPFVQVDSKLSRKYDGTGLGLALSRRLAHLHDGEIVVDSEAGRGSRFTLVLPWQPQTDALTQVRTIPSTSDLLRGAEPLLAELPSVAMAHQGATLLSRLQPTSKDFPDKPEVVEVVIPVTDQTETLILLAEDNELNVETITEFLELSGYRLMVAGNGEEVLTLVEQTIPDIILMDVQMPIMDGLTATRTLRKTDAYAEIPIVAITGMAMPGDAQKCLDAGATDYLSKPLNFKEMIATIERYTA